MEKIIRNNTVHSNGLPTVVLGISPGTRTLGYAVLKDSALIDWGIKAFQQTWSKHKAIIILQTILKLLSEYQVGCLVIKTIPDTKANTSVMEIVRSVKQSCNKHEIAFYEYSLTTLKQSHEVALRNKQDVMKRMALLYHHTKKLYEKEMTNRNCYYIKLFEALLAAHTHNEQNKMSGDL